MFFAINYNLLKLFGLVMKDNFENTENIAVISSIMYNNVNIG